MLSEIIIQAVQTAYLAFGVPSDKLAGDPKALENFTELVNTFIEDPFYYVSTEELRDKLIPMRKSGKLPALGRRKSKHAIP